MANQYGLFFNSESGDRVYDADSFAEWLEPFFKNGVFLGGFTTTANGDMTLTVSPGIAYINGKLRTVETSTVLTIETASSVYPRIDNIVVERNDTDRQITIKVVKGSYNGSTAAASNPQRSNNVYQLVLARVAVSAGATTITADSIADCRADTSLCGYVSNAIDSPDFESWYTLNEQQFNEWFGKMKGQLSTDAAGNLQNEIDALASTTKNVTLSASSWSSSFYTISDALITATSNQEILPAVGITLDQLKALQTAMLVDGGQTAGSLTLKALGTVPTIDIPIRIIFRGEK